MEDMKNHFIIFAYKELFHEDIPISYINIQKAIEELQKLFLKNSVLPSSSQSSFGHDLTNNEFCSSALIVRRLFSIHDTLFSIISKEPNQLYQSQKEKFKNLINQYASLTGYFMPLEEPNSLNEKLPQIMSDLLNQMKEKYQKKEKKAIKIYQAGHICCKCRSSPATYIAFPCHHPLLCDKCFEDIFSRHQMGGCVICNKTISSFQRLNYRPN